MAKQLSKKSVILVLAGLTVAGLACAVVRAIHELPLLKENEQPKVDKYLGEYQEEAVRWRQARRGLLQTKITNASLSDFEVSH